MKYDVITVGSNTIDTFVYTDRVESLSVKSKEDEDKYICYPLGSKLRINTLDFGTGGGGTNTAVCLSRLGLKTAYFGKTGNDLNGTIIRDELEKEGVDFIGLVSTDEKLKSGYSVVLDSIEHNRTILTYRGANDEISGQEIDFKKFDSEWFHFSAMVEKSFSVLEEMASFAKKRNIKISFNPNNYLCEKGPDFLKNILDNTKIFVLNNEEASLLVKDGTISEKLSALKTLGPEIVVITDGTKPVHCVDAGGKFYTMFPLDIPVVEVTGAGDSFASSFLAGMIKKNDLVFFP